MFFFFNDTATTEIYTLSLHDALPISCRASTRTQRRGTGLPRPGRPRPPRGAGSSSGLLPPLERAATPLEERDAAPHAAHGGRHVEHRRLHFLLDHLAHGEIGRASGRGRVEI